MEQRATKPIGIAIAVATGLATLGICVVMWRSWTAAQPTQTIGTVGVRYQAGAVHPWPDLERCVGVARAELQSRWPAKANEVMTFWLDVVEPGGLVRSVDIPDGMLLGADGKLHQVHGTILTEDFFVGTIIKRVMRVQQQLGPDGKVLSPCRGADEPFFHEIAEHQASFLLNQDRDADHKPEWVELRVAMERRAASTP